MLFIALSSHLSRSVVRPYSNPAPRAAQRLGENLGVAAFVAGGVRATSNTVGKLAKSRFNGQ